MALGVDETLRAGRAGRRGRDRVGDVAAATSLAWSWLSSGRALPPGGWQAAPPAPVPDRLP